jgi:hypothetical protein
MREKYGEIEGTKANSPRANSSTKNERGQRAARGGGQFLPAEFGED